MSKNLKEIQVSNLSFEQVKQFSVNEIWSHGPNKISLFCKSCNIDLAIKASETNDGL